MKKLFLIIAVLLVVPSFALAWESCQIMTPTSTTLLTLPPQPTGASSSPLYLFNKTTPFWDFNFDYPRYFQHYRSAISPNDTWETATGTITFVCNGSGYCATDISSNTGNYKQFTGSVSGDYVVHNMGCINGDLSQGYGCFATSTAQEWCFTNEDPVFTPPEPEEETFNEEPYILYYGESPYYVETEGTGTMPVIYNVCKDWDNEKVHHLLLTDSALNEPLFSDSFIELTQCSGSLQFNFSTKEFESFNIAKLKIYQNDDILVETENIYIGVVDLISTGNSMIEFITESPIYINRTGYGTTTILTFVQMLADGLEIDNEICILNEAGQKTENCVDAQEGIKYLEIEIPIPEYDTTQIINIGLYDKQTDKIILQSNSPVYLIVYASFYDQDTWTNQFSTTSAAAFLGLNSVQLACSPAEWADTSWQQTLICSGKKFVFDVVFIIEKVIKSFMGMISKGMDTTFPFSIIKKVNTLWKNSATQPLPADLNWIAPEGDLILTVPKNWTQTDENLEIVAFGDSIFKTGDNSIVNFFAKIRALSKYFLMIGLILSFIKFSEYFYWKHLSNENAIVKKE